MLVWEQYLALIMAKVSHKIDLAVSARYHVECILITSTPAWLLPAFVVTRSTCIQVHALSYHLIVIFMKCCLVMTVLQLCK